MLGASVLFSIAYIIGVANLLELINANTELEYDWEHQTIAVVDSDLGQDTTWAIYELLMAMVNSYMVLYMAPILISSVVIILKEATLKQWAMSYEEDWKEGEVYDYYDFSFLHFLGLHQDEEYFNKGLKDFMQEYV